MRTRSGVHKKYLFPLLSTSLNINVVVLSPGSLEFSGSLDLYRACGLYVSGGKLHVCHLSPQDDSKIDNLEKELSTGRRRMKVNKMK